MTYRPNFGKKPSALGVMSGTPGRLIITNTDTDDFGVMSLSDAAQYGSIDPATLEQLSALPSGGFLMLGYRLSDMVPKLLVSTALGTGTGAPPGGVGSLAAGTPTSTTIPVTYTAASGSATIAYAGWTRPHSGGSWNQNGGTFTGTGGTFTGLTASTSYDLRVVATNSAGSSNTDLTTGVSTAATGGGGTTRPPLTLNNPVFGTSKFAQGLAGGTAMSPAITAGSASGLGLWFSATNGNPYATILQLLGFASFGTSFGGADLTGDYANHPVSSSSPPGSTSSPAICDGAMHWIYADSNGGTINAYVDGVGFRTENRALGSSFTVNLAPADIAGCVVSELALWNTSDPTRKTPPTGPLNASDANLLGLWRLNGNGVSA